MKKRRRRKNVNDTVPLNFLLEIEHTKIVKWKEDSEPLEMKTNLGKKRKVNDLDSSGCPKKYPSMNKRKMIFKSKCYFFNLM